LKQSTDEDKASRNYWRRHFPNTPTATELHRHAERFGREGVDEIAAVYEIELNASTARQAGPRSKRHTGPALREQVIELHGRGLLPTAIADVLNVSDRRVKEVLDQVAA
jgi:hypothetical protein